MPLFYQKLPDNTIFLCIISRVPHYKIFHVKNEFQSQKNYDKKIQDCNLTDILSLGRSPL